MTTPKSVQEHCSGVGSWIVSTAHAFRQALECELTQQGITFRQWEVLFWLNAEGKQPQSGLADRMGLEAQTLAGIISRMERDGWLTRESCSKDRRRKLLQPTEKAEQIWNSMHACCNRVRDRATLGLEQEHLETLERICEQIRNNLASACSEMDRELELLSGKRSASEEPDCAGEETTTLNMEETDLI